MLVRQIERVRQARRVDRIVIATTTKSEDDPIFFLACEAGVACFRGSETDVLDRYYQAAKETRADIIIRITGDCPLSDPGVIDETIEYFLKNAAEIDYTSKPTNYPEGLDVEIFPFSILERAWKEGSKPSEREHVTSYVYNHPEIFRIRTWQNGKEDFSMLHWSVDTAEDLMFVTKIFEALYPSKQFFSKDDVLALLKKTPDLLSVNRGGTGYEGYAKSLKEDEQFQKKRDIYKRMIGFVPEVIIIFSGGIIKEIGKDGIATYRSTKENEGDSFGMLWGEARVIAAAELALHFPHAKIITTGFYAPNEPTQAEIIRNELEKFSIPRSRVLLEMYSHNTLSQIKKSLKITIDRKWQRVAIVTNEYHIPRVRAMYEHFEKLLPQAVKFSGVQVAFIAAESILPYRDKKFIEIIERMKNTEGYRKRLLSEEKGTEMILSGEYGKHQSKQEDKFERKI